MKSSTVIRTLVAMVFAAAFGLAGLTACSSGGGAATGSDAVAATVNGTEIKEDTITDYIQNFREAQQVSDDEAWGTWLSQYNMTPSDVRSDVIDYFVGTELVKQAAEEKGVTVADEDVQEQVDQMKANYSDDEAWQAALEEAGRTEDEYRENVRTSMLESALQEKIIEENNTGVTDEALLEQASQYAPYFDGAKKSSHILFNADDQETAQQVLDQISNGEIDFADAAKEYSQDTGSAENGGDVGWDMLNSFVTEYTDALNELDEGQTSGLVTSDYGLHIIRCMEVFHAPDEITSLDQLPAELVEYIRTMADSTAESEAYSNWYEEYEAAADIQKNDMPEGLPYDIDESLYASASSSETSSELPADDAGVEVDETAVSEAEATSSELAQAAADEATSATSEAVEAASSEASEDAAA